MKIAAMMMATLALAGCATTQDCPPAGVKVVYQPVTKETQRPCAVTVPKRPDPLPAALPVDAIKLAALLGAKLAEWSGPGGYGERADAALRTCTKP